MKNKISRELWEYCYRQVRQINGYLNAAKIEMEDGNTAGALWLAMEAGELITHAETGYSTEGSVYVYKMSGTMEFNVYVANGDRYEFVFPFGDNTPRNKRAKTNRCEWQHTAQQLEKQLLEEKVLFDRMDKNREIHREIAYYLSYLNDDGLFKAYEAIKELAEIYY